MGNKRLTKYQYWRGTAEQWSTSALLNRSFSVSSVYDRVGADDPFYKQKIKDNASATNSLRTKVQSIYFKKGAMTGRWIDKVYQPTWTGKVIKSDWLDNFTPAVHTELPPFLFRNSTSNTALLGIIKKIRKHESSDFAGPTFLGELRETIKMIKSPVEALRKKTNLFTDLHMRILRDKRKRAESRGRRIRETDWSKVLSDTYLEWTFGAKPLISDIGAICDVYLDTKTRAIQNGLKRLSYRFSDATNSVKEAPGGYLVVPGTGFLVYCDEVSHFRSSSQYVVWIDQSFIFADTQVATLSDMAKFDLAEIVPTTWELMPWSFLIDYFTNIGDVLGCTFNFNRNVKFAKLTTFNTCVKYHANFKPKAAEPSIYEFTSYTPHNYTSSYIEVSRSAVDRLGFPQLDVQLPNLGQTINMAALMTSLRNNNPFRGHVLK